MGWQLNPFGRIEAEVGSAPRHGGLIDRETVETMLGKVSNVFFGITYILGIRSIASVSGLFQSYRFVIEGLSLDASIEGFDEALSVGFSGLLKLIATLFG